jgi:hypothetical protein
MKYVLSAGIEPTHMASEANALSTELGERLINKIKS